MKAPFNMEDDIWHALINRDEKAITKCVTEDAVVIYNGERLKCSHFLDRIFSLGIFAYTIDNVELVMNEESPIQIIYNAMTLAINSGGDKVKNRLCIANTWVETGDDAEIVCSIITSMN